MPRDWNSRRLYVLRRDRWTCRIQGPECLAPYPGGLWALEQQRRRLVAADHVKPRHLGGSDDVGNLRAACAKCNGGRPRGGSAKNRARRQRDKARKRGPDLSGVEIARRMLE